MNKSATIQYRELPAREKTDESRSMRDILADRDLTASEAAWECFRQYAHERPEAIAMWAFGVGFVLGWKLKLW